MTSPGSDSVRAQIAEAHRDAHGIRPVYAIDYDFADVLLASPAVDRLRAEAKAEALEEAAGHAVYYAPEFGPGVPLWRLRAVAAAYRTNPSKETDRG